MCCDGWEAEPEKKAGVCPECDGDIDADGDSVEAGCSYSPPACHTCGWRPCDGSC